MQWLRRWVVVEAREVGALLWAAAWFFTLLSTYYMLRPLRDALGVSQGTEALKWLFSATFVTTLVAMPVYTTMVARLPRTRLLTSVYHVATLCLVAFAALLTFATEGVRAASGYVFFVWLSVYNVFGLTAVFWAFLADIYTQEQGRRLFGFIAAGGTLGAVAGSAVARQFVSMVGVSGVMLTAAAGLQVAVFCMRRLARLHGEPPPASQPVATLTDAFRGGAQVWRSRYLLAIAAVMCFDILTSTYLYRAQGQAAKALLADDQARAEFFATVDLGANLLVLALEVFVVGQMLRKVGVGLALVALALVSFGSVAALALAPGLLVLGMVQVLRRGIEFGLAKPAREVLFTVVPRQQKYEAKAFIDTVVNRGSDVAVLWTLSLLPNVDARAVALVAVPLAVAWVWLSVRLGFAFAQRARG